MTTDQDLVLLHAINNEKDEARQIQLMNEYWQDPDRKDRTGRSWLIFHVGMLTQSQTLGPLMTVILTDLAGTFSDG